MLKPHFTNVETEVSRSEVSCPIYPSWAMSEPGIEHKFPTSESMTESLEHRQSLDPLPSIKGRSIMFILQVYLTHFTLEALFYQEFLQETLFRKQL